MNEPLPQRGVDVRRTGAGMFTGRNPRGAEVRIGPSDAPGVFTPGELLLIAAAACAGVTAESLIVRRLGPDAEVTVRAAATKESEDAHEYASIETVLATGLASLPDEQRTAPLDAIRRAVERYCTVSRTVEKGTPVTLEVE